jgi:hypothetical protein
MHGQQNIRSYMHATCFAHVCMLHVSLMYACYMFRSCMHATCFTHVCMPHVSLIYACYMFRSSVYATCFAHLCMLHVSLISYFVYRYSIWHGSNVVKLQTQVSTKRTSMYTLFNCFHNYGLGAVRAFWVQGNGAFPISMQS